MMHSTQIDFPKQRLAKKVLLILALTSLIPVSANADTNLIQNGGFETGDTTSWTQIGDWGPGFGVANMVAGNTYGDNVNSGNYALWFGNSFDTAGVSQTFSDTQGTHYQFSFEMSQTGGRSYYGTNPIYPANVTLDGTTLSLAQGQPQQNGTWTNFTFNFVGKGSDTIALSGYSGTGWLGVDNVNVHATSAVPEAGEWAMMLLGLPLVGWVVRRKQS